VTSKPAIADRSIGDYLSSLGSSAPAPGGGSVAGLIGALASALGQMVSSVTLKGNPDSAINAQTEALQGRLQDFLTGSEADEAAYGAYVAATSLPKGSDFEKAHRREMLQEALHVSARTPLAIASNAVGLLADLIPVIECGGKHILSDAEIAIVLGEATVAAALVNVRINLPMIRDADVALSFVEQMAEVESQAAANADRCREALARRRSASSGT
jgi:formiminotetrahydrofolate cyclodeaminase